MRAQLFRCLAVYAVNVVGMSCDARLAEPIEYPVVLGISHREVVLESFAGNPVAVFAVVNVFDNGDGSAVDLMGQLGMQVVQGGEWITVTGDPARSEITIAASAVDLAEGVHAGEIVFSHPAAKNAPRTLTVEFRVGEGPVLGLSTDSLQFHHLPYDPGREFFKTLSVVNLGGGRLGTVEIGDIAYNPTDSVQDWLTPQPVSPDFFAFYVVYPDKDQCAWDGGPLGRLAGNICSAFVPITSSIAKNAVTLTVLLTFDFEPTIFLSPKGITFNALEGGSDPPGHLVTLTHTGVVDDPPLTGYVLGIPVDFDLNPASWLTATLQDSIVSVDANVDGLTEGTYFGNVSITHPPVASQGTVRPVLPDTIRVLLEVKPPLPLPAAIVLDVDTVMVGATAEVVKIYNGGTGSLTGISVEENEDWLLAFLDVNVATSESPAHLTLTKRMECAANASTTVGIKAKDQQTGDDLVANLTVICQ